MKTKKCNYHHTNKDTSSIKQSTLRTIVNNHIDMEINKKKRRCSDYNKSNNIMKNYTTDNNTSSLNLTTINKIPLTYNNNCSKELLILNSISKNDNNLLQNNYIINQKTVLSLLNNTKIRSCYLCRSNSTKLINTIDCPHLFCDVCIQLLINKNFLTKENSFKCPIIPCNSRFEQDSLKVFFLSKDSFSDKSKTFDSSCVINNSSKHNTNEEIRVYHKTGKITSGRHKQFKSNGFLFFMKNKGRYCRNCCSDKLYSPIGKLIFICLNCSKRVCQKCYRYCDETHFNVKYVNHCPILDSRHKKDNNQKSIQEWFKLYFFELLGLVIGWLILFLGTVLNMKQFLFCSRERKAKTTFITISLDCLSYSMIFLLVLIEMCVFVIMLPYHSAILLLFDYNSYSRSLFN